MDSPTATNLVAAQVETTEPITPKKEAEQETRDEAIPPKSPENLPVDVSSSVEGSPVKPAPLETDEPTTPVTETIEAKNENDDPEPMDTESKDEATEEKVTNVNEIESNEIEEVPEEKSVEEEDFIKEEISSVSNAASTEEKTEDEEDDEVILKSLDIPSGDDTDAKKIRAVIQRPSRNKKTSEVSEEEGSIDESTKQRNRETRSKKISERSDDTEESPAPRNTRRRGKLDDSSNERDEIAENKRLNRIKGTTYCTLAINMIFFIHRIFFQNQIQEVDVEVEQHLVQARPVVPMTSQKRTKFKLHQKEQQCHDQEKNPETAKDG